jgi:hypothetical protein
MILKDYEAETEANEEQEQDAAEHSYDEHDEEVWQFDPGICG